MGKESQNTAGGLVREDARNDSAEEARSSGPATDAVPADADRREPRRSARRA